MIAILVGRSGSIGSNLRLTSRARQPNMRVVGQAHTHQINNLTD